MKKILFLWWETFFEINNFLQKLNSKKITLLHGFQSYPINTDINLNRLKQIKSYFKNRYEYGYQDHTAGSVITIYIFHY